MARFFFRALLCISVLSVIAAADALAANIDHLRLWRAPDHTRIVFDLDAPVEHQLFTLKNPERIVIDFPETKMRAQPDSLSLDKTPIASLRHAPKSGGALRVVLDLKQSVRPRSFLLRRHEQLPDRLVLDLYDRSAGVQKTLDQVHGARDVVIAIDPGHGGEDPGALGPGKLREKDVVLAIARKLQQHINRARGFSAKLVRSGDYYVPLRKRVNRGREWRADLFVSIHADAFKDKKARGAGVYALSSRGATSETARFLAQRENESDLIGGAGSLSLDGKDETLVGVLLDLSMTASMNASLEIGNRVLTGLGQFVHLHKKRVEQANFAQLRSPDVPSILVETGFITNPEEARRLRNPQFQQRMAQRIGDSIVAHFHARPPAGSWLAAAARGRGREHIISRGDTLSGIAARYNVSVAALKKANGLGTSTIRTGQKLAIPPG